MLLCLNSFSISEVNNYGNFIKKFIKKVCKSFLFIYIYVITFLFIFKRIDIFLNPTQNITKQKKLECLVTKKGMEEIETGFKTLKIRAFILYCGSVWDPFTKSIIDKGKNLLK